MMNALRPQKKIIGLVLPAGFTTALDTFLTRMFRLLSAAVEAKGYQLAFFDDKDDNYAAIEHDRENGSLAGALIFAPSANDFSKIEHIRDTGTPLAVIFSHFDGVDSFTCDNVLGGYIAAKHLIDKGRRKIAFMHGHPSWLDSNDRFIGFKKALEDSGVEFFPGLVNSGFNNVVKGKIAAREFFTQWNRPDAIFAANDMMAIGCISAITEKGLKVPGDVSVIGFDNISDAEFSEPPLTTVNQPMKEILDAAVARLVDVIDGKVKAGETVFKTFKPELIVRISA